MAKNKVFRIKIGYWIRVLLKSIQKKEFFLYLTKAIGNQNSEIWLISVLFTLTNGQHDEFKKTAHLIKNYQNLYRVSRNQCCQFNEFNKCVELTDEIVDITSIQSAKDYYNFKQYNCSSAIHVGQLIGILLNNIIGIDNVCLNNLIELLTCEKEGINQNSCLGKSSNLYCKWNKINLQCVTIYNYLSLYTCNNEYQNEKACSASPYVHVLLLFHLIDVLVLKIIIVTILIYVNSIMDQQIKKLVKILLKVVKNVNQFSQQINIKLET